MVEFNSYWFAYHSTLLLEQAWYMDDIPGDQREPHKTDRSVTGEELDALGVLRWSGIKGAEDPELDKVSLFSPFFLFLLTSPQLIFYPLVVFRFDRSLYFIV